VQARVHTTLLQLLGSTDPAVLPPVLVALLGYAQQPQYYALVAGPDSLELLLRVVQQYELPFKRHAGTAPLPARNRGWQHRGVTGCPAGVSHACHALLQCGRAWYGAS
jgi:hypothetical protein